MYASASITCLADKLRSVQVDQHRFVNACKRYHIVPTLLCDVIGCWE